MEYEAVIGLGGRSRTKATSCSRPRVSLGTWFRPRQTASGQLVDDDEPPGSLLAI